MSMNECIKAVAADGPEWDWWVGGTILDYSPGQDFASATVVCWDPAKYEAWLEAHMDEWEAPKPPTLTVTVTAQMIASAIADLLASPSVSEHFRDGLWQAVVDPDDCGNMDADMADCIMQQAVYGEQRWG